MKVIIYCRKSTDREDRQVQSLGDQLKWCQEMAQNLSYDVVTVISEAMSAKNPETRPEFKKMLNLLKSWKADGVITWKCNRLARNPIDQSYIEWYLQEGIIKEIVSSDGFFRTWDNVLILRMHFWMSTQYVLDLKKDTLRGMRSKVEKGWIVAKPPRGYDIVAGEAKPWDEAKIIKDIFTLRNQGWGMPDIAEEMFRRHKFRTKTGKPVMHTYIAKVLQNPFYYGAIQWAWELFRGRHEPIISRDLYDKVNHIRRWTSYAKQTDNPIFKLRGMVYDYDTWAILTASLIKGKYTYFHTSTRSKKKIYINQQAIIDWFESNIHMFVIPRQFFDEIKKILVDMTKDQTKEAWQFRKKFSQKEAELIANKQKLLTLRLNEEISQEVFLEEKNRIISELQEVKGNLLNVDDLDDTILENTDIFLSFCTNLVQDWKRSDLEWKIDIIKLLSTNLFVKSDNSVIYKFFPLWEATYEINKNSHKYGNLSGIPWWLPDIVQSSNCLSRLVEWIIQESKRIELYKEVLDKRIRNKSQDIFTMVGKSIL